MDNTRMKKEYHDIPILENGEILVRVSGISPRIQVFPYYYHQGISGAYNECYVREGVAERLIIAAELLPPGYSLVVLDGWRPYQVQQALFELVRNNLLESHPGAAESDINKLLHTFVAHPSQDIYAPSPHLTGGAVDLTIGRAEEWLNMGTDFDETSERSRTDWYERNPCRTEEEQIIQKNRKLLVESMTRAGFVNYEEWWHYEFGNQRWASLTGNTACYAGILSL
jgi:D-alanyl-D-alanine dipeptidase